MPTAVTSFAFATTLQSWSSIAALASGETNGLDTVNGNPADALFGKLVGKTKATTAGAGMKLSQSLTAWGVPAGCTVTAVSVALDKKCVTAPGSAIGSGSFNSKLNLNAGASTNTGPTQTLSTTADTSWTTLGTGSNAALSGLSDSTLSHTLEVDILYTLSTTSSAVVGTTWQIDWDNVVVTVTYSPNVPAAPNTPTGTNGHAQVPLSWTDNATNGAAITDHHVYVYDAPSGGSLLNTIDTASATTSYTVTSLTNGVAYYFEVTATNSAGESAHSSRSTIAQPTALSLVTSGSSITGAITLTPTAGDTLVVFALGNMSPSPDVLSISDTAGNGWIAASSPIQGATFEEYAWVAQNVAGGATTITVAAGGTLVWGEYRTATPGQYVALASSTSGTTTVSPLTLSVPTAVDEYALYGLVTFNVTSGASLTGYTTEQNPASLMLQDKLPAATSTEAISDTSTIGSSPQGEINGILLVLRSVTPLIARARVISQAVNRSNTY